jgi:hypothetical protein
MIAGRALPAQLHRIGTSSLAFAVHVGAVVNVHDDDGTTLLIDPIHHPVLAATRGMMTGKLEMQRPAYSLRVVSE